MSKTSITRQVIDLQAQAERLIRTKGNMPEIEAFSQYNEEIKAYLFDNIDDDFVLKYIKNIPSLDLDAIETKSGLLTLVVGLISGGSASAYHERHKIEQALDQIKEISNKYASYEMMIRNYFNN
ncbi:hypothetical protein [uncultured Winogradskyella sp.]|uniref:hypothetical protein n=1 Tax=uncultured Winogradskyella sp. TaxID=395353 RepID=UPI002638BAA5|nr:hypothetical protein [uncultured Winogradskyella sp.]